MKTNLAAHFGTKDKPPKNAAPLAALHDAYRDVGTAGGLTLLGSGVQVVDDALAFQSGQPAQLQIATAGTRRTDGGNGMCRDQFKRPLLIYLDLADESGRDLIKPFNLVPN